MSHASLLLELERKDAIINNLASKVAEQKRTLEKVLSKIHSVEETIRNDPNTSLEPVLKQKDELIKRLTAENASLRSALEYSQARALYSSTAHSSSTRKASSLSQTIDDLVNSFN